MNPKTNLKNLIFTIFTLIIFLFSLSIFSTTYACNNLTLNLKKGSNNNEVKLLQQYLNNNNYPLATTGIGSKDKETTYFGNLTKLAVIKYQKDNKLKGDGYVGSLTRAILNKCDTKITTIPTTPCTNGQIYNSITGFSCSIKYSGSITHYVSLHYTAGSNGTLTGDTNQRIVKGHNGTSVTAVPDPNYSFVDWSDASTDNPRTDLNVTDNISVTANFAWVCGSNQVIVVSTAEHTCNESDPYYDKCTYDTVQIGTQCWTKQNMNVGNIISGVTNMTDNSILEKYCYNNDFNYCLTYGGLYNLPEAMEYSLIEDSFIEGAQGICPTGWHIPTDAEQFILENYLTDSPNTCVASREATSDCLNAGGKLKESGTAHWDSPNTGATNSSLFTGLPAGGRGPTGTFVQIGKAFRLLSSSIDDSHPTYFWNRRISITDGSAILRQENTFMNGWSVRCLKD